MKVKIYLGLMLLGFSAVAQQNQTGPAPGAIIFPPSLPNVKNQTENAWYRGGNFAGGDGGNKNIFGTKWNSPIYTQTDGITRAKQNLKKFRHLLKQKWLEFLPTIF